MKMYLTLTMSLPNLVVKKVQQSLLLIKIKIKNKKLEKENKEKKKCYEKTKRNGKNDINGMNV